MDNGSGHCAWWQSCKVRNQTHRGIKDEKMYDIKQVKVSAEYQDMLPRPRMVCPELGLRPVGRCLGIADKTTLDLNLYINQLK